MRAIQKWQRHKEDGDIQTGYISFLPTLPAHTFCLPLYFLSILWKWQSSRKIYGPLNSRTISQLDTVLLIFSKRGKKCLGRKCSVLNILRFNCARMHFCWQLSVMLMLMSHANTAWQFSHDIMPQYTETELGCGCECLPSSHILRNEKLKCWMNAENQIPVWKPLKNRRLHL